MIQSLQHRTQSPKTARNARCLLISAPGKIEQACTSIPSPECGEVLVRTAWSCISPGTETRVFEGTEPGLPDYPFIPGYAMTGTVVECGTGCRLQVGAKVFCSGTQRAEHPLCWGGHTEFAVVNENKVLPIPEAVDLRLASTAKLAAIAHHGVRLSQPSNGQTVAVVGLGPIGLLSALIHAQSGATVIATDLNADRCKMAQDLGIRIAAYKGCLKSTFASDFPNGADIVVEATGVNKVLSECTHLLKMKPWDDAEHPSARILIQASYASGLSIDYFSAFAAEAILLFPRDCQMQDIAAVLQLMATNKLDIADFVQNIGDLSQATASFLNLRATSGKYITYTIDWHS